MNFIAQVFKGLDWVEKLMFVPSRDLVIAGFHTVSLETRILLCQVLQLTGCYSISQAYFVVWSVEKNQLIFKVKCGGGHRAWDFALIQTAVSRRLKKDL